MELEVYLELIINNLSVEPLAQSVKTISKSVKKKSIQWLKVG